MDLEAHWSDNEDEELDDMLTGMGDDGPGPQSARIQTPPKHPIINQVLHSASPLTRSPSWSPFIGPADQFASPLAEEINNVPYENHSAIDWSLEFKKDRLRKSYIANIPGLTGKLLMVYDVSHVWLVLVATGLLVGVVAAMVSIVSQWLGDLKFGYCQAGFYLKKDFCCWGLREGEYCPDWKPWPQTVGIHSGAAHYIFAYLIYTLATICFSVAASRLVLSYAPYSKLSGIAEIKTILGGHVMHGFLGTNTLAVKAIGLCFVVGAGIWAGQDGPLVHIAVCCCNAVLSLLKPTRPNEAKKREMLSAAAAAGISVAFGSPIGGVLFTLEVLTYYATDTIMWHGFVCAMVAAVCLQTMNPYRIGQLVLFQITYDRNWYRFELFPFAFIGILGGLYGAAMIKLNMRFAKWRSSSPFTLAHPIAEVALVALVTAITSYPDVYMRIQPSVLLSYLFQECSTTTPGNLCNIDAWSLTFFLLLIAGFIGLFLTAYTFGISIPSGIIMPSMTVGALGGRLVGLVMQAWQERHRNFILFSSCPPDGICVTPGVYALVGAASALTGATRLTVSSVVIMFELTGALNYVLPIMAGVMVSKWVADSFGKQGIYQSWIHHLQYPMLDWSEDAAIPDVPVVDVMTSTDELILIHCSGYTVFALQGLLGASGQEGFPIIRSEGDNTLIGYIPRRELQFALESRLKDGKITPDTRCYFEPFTDENGFDLRPWTDLAPITLSVHTSLELALNIVESLGLRYVLFTLKGNLEGMMTKKDIWKVMNGFERRLELDSGREPSLGNRITEALLE